MAFLDETGLSTFKSNCDSHYVRLNGGSSTQTVSSSKDATLGLKLTKTNGVVGENQSSTVYGPIVQMYDKNGAPCGQIAHSFRTGTTRTSSLAFYAQNKMSTGTQLSGGFAVYRAYDVQSDTDGTTYWFSSKPNVRMAIGIFSGTTAPTTNTARGTGDIYIQY